jgi:hypothetical protein
MSDVDQLLQIFARSIFAKVGALKSLDLTPNQHKRLQASIKEDVRACGGFLFPDVRAPEVSEAALREAKRRKVENIHEKTWHSQSSFDAGRKTFHWEHVDPVSAIQEATEAAVSEKQVFEILNRRLRIAWILKKEDKKLKKLGFRSKRPDPEAAYLAAKIVLVKHRR